MKNNNAKDKNGWLIGKKMRDWLACKLNKNIEKNDLMMKREINAQRGGTYY